METPLEVKHATALAAWPVLGFGTKRPQALPNLAVVLSLRHASRAAGQHLLGGWKGWGGQSAIRGQGE